MKTYDVLVIGAGGVGSAAMLELAKRGLSVIGIDRFTPPHSRGSSHGQTRVIRQAYFEHPDYVPLLHRTYELWRGLEGTAGIRLFQQCGLLEVGPADGEVVAGVLQAASQHSLRVETLTAAEVQTRWAGLVIPEGLAAVFEPTAGYLHVERCVQTMLSEAKNLGAELCSPCEVYRWQSSDGQVQVETDQGTLHGKSLVVTAGAWAGPLLSELGIPLQPLRKSIYWYPTEAMPAAKELPVYLYELPKGIWYGFPSLDGHSMKLAEHTGGLPVDDPLAVETQVDQDEQAGVTEFVRHCLPAAGRTPVEHATCLYTMTPDHHFVVDRHPDKPNVVFAAGLSGHGFKFAPVLGEALADLVTQGKTELPIGFLCAGRFHER